MQKEANRYYWQNKEEIKASSSIILEIERLDVIKYSKQMDRYQKQTKTIRARRISALINNFYNLHTIKSNLPIENFDLKLKEIVTPKF